MLWAATLLVLTTSADPRLQVTQHRLEGRLAEALEVLDASVAENGDSVLPLGLDYLRGHLLEALGRDRAAQEAFARSLTSATTLAPYGLFRLALNHEARGHPEVSAGLLANLLGGSPPPRLVRPAVVMLSEVIEHGADCRLLGNSDRWRLEQSANRRLQVAKAGCDLIEGSRERAVERLLAILARSIDDEAARLAADRVSQLVGPDAPPEVSLLLGRTFHAHRRFDLSVLYLRRGLAALEEDDLDARYALARSYFWREEYLLAASEFGKVAAGATRPGVKARALYQQGRSYEVSGNWAAASASYRIAYLGETDGRWADAALLSALRIEWRSGSEKPALELYEVLASKRSWARIFESASVFLASSEIVRNRAERAGEWLDRARRARREPSVDATYWSARLAELERDRSQAVELYVEILTENPYHPLAVASRQRLARSDLVPVAEAMARRIARGSSTAGLYGAMLLLPDNDPAAVAARRRLTERLSSKASARAFLQIQLRDTADWPIWQASREGPEELLLGLGLWGEGEAAILEYFSIDEPDLALTAVGLLERADSLRPALRIAEILYLRAVAEIPIDLLPENLRRAAFPLHYRDLIIDRSSRFEVDPFLLAAIVREESRFDAQAVSAAAARGLAQFVLPTAKRLAASIGIEALRAEDLHRPDIALTLGAAYLAQLGRRFADQPYAVIAAYNAGENQAQLWRSYCFSREPEEYFSKVGFAETRGYLTKVLESRAHYAVLYGDQSGARLTPMRTSAGVSEERSK
ncbi:MAG: transglycosylase SLT domain-containing protein [Acidobacteria bacterium]|nr:transglycosylase SLT domain-containing protein [Acidobacteriota bacterium]